MEHTSVDNRILQAMESTHFAGFSLDDVRAGLQVLADAVASGGGQVTNGTSEEILESLRDERPFIIQNHGSPGKALETWGCE